MAGRRPKPTQLHLVRGNPGKRKRNAREPKPRRVIPSPPADLSEKARTAWGALSVILDRAGLITEADVFALERACETVAEVQELKADIAENGRTQKVKIKGAKKGEKSVIMERQRPQVSMLQDADRRLKAWLVEFGLTPAARTKVEANPENGTADALAEFV